MQDLTPLRIRLAEKGLIPDRLIRLGIRLLLRKRLHQEEGRHALLTSDASRTCLDQFSSGPIATSTEEANEQHYGLPSDFFASVLGNSMKYSCNYWPEGVNTLDAAEEAMLNLITRRAGIEKEMEILDLGCGWGSFSLWAARSFPESSILAVSNSAEQRAFIQKKCRDQGLQNVEVITADMNDFSTERRFDRVVSIEMFEHMRNYGELLRRIAGWMKPGGKLFVHIFCHRRYSYRFERDGDDNWMGNYFFTGGVMPSCDLLMSFQNDLVMEDHWCIPGVHYQRTADEWLLNMTRNKENILAVLNRTYGSEHARLWFQRWRMFFMACAELWGFRGGREWLVGHYLFHKA